MHPLARWIEDHHTTPAAFLARLVARDVRTREGTLASARWLREILGGWRRPTYEVCKVIAEETGGGVTVDALREYQRPAPLVSVDAKRRRVKRVAAKSARAKAQRRPGRGRREVAA